MGGEIRAVNRIESRIAEAEKLGFKQIYILKYNTKGLNLKDYGIQMRPVAKLEEVFGELIG